MPDNFPALAGKTRKPTPDRPLLGQTLLVVEDSRFASEAVRLMCLHSGARLRRADCLASAHRHLAVYRPTVVLVDVGLPDGSGLDLIRELARAEPRVPVILATSGEDNAEEAALAAGSDGFIPKPIASLAAFQQAVLEHLPPDTVPASPRALPSAMIEPDPVALRDDLTHIAALLVTAPDAHTTAYVAQFLHSLGVSGDDKGLLAAAADLQAPGAAASSALGDLRGLIQTRLQQTPAF
jgi:CheY-like chemotaxis protein